MVTRLAYACLALFLVGCSAGSNVVGGQTSIEKTRRTVPESVTHTTTMQPDGTSTTSVTHAASATEETAKGVAIGARASVYGDKFENKVTGEAPTIDLGGDTASGGGLTSAARVIGGAGKTTAIIFGVLLIAGGIAVAAYLRLVSVGLAVSGAGGLVLAIAFYPALMLWIGVVAVVGFCVYALWSGRLVALQRHTLGAVTAAVAKSDKSSDIRSEVKQAVGPSHERVLLNAKQWWQRN
jgi:hypothetical protein